MTTEQFTRIKEYVLLLGNFEDTQKLDLQIEMMINEALEYCYRCDIPLSMELPLADAIVNEIGRTNALGGLDGNITSYREGDMSINFGGVTNTNGTAIKYGGKLEGFKKVIGAV